MRYRDEEKGFSWNVSVRLIFYVKRFPSGSAS
jgi:hypothetical protein